MYSVERNFLLAFGFFTLLTLGQGSCWRYGHSCWGGHGKRSGGGGGEEDSILPLEIYNPIPIHRGQIRTRFIGDSTEREGGGGEDLRNYNSVQDEETDSLDELELGGGEVDVEGKEDVTGGNGRGLMVGRRLLIYDVLRK